MILQKPSLKIYICINLYKRISDRFSQSRDIDISDSLATSARRHLIHQVIRGNEHDLRT